MKRIARFASLGFTVILASLFCTGCGMLAARKPFTCPEKGGAAWSEVTSAHFTLHTDLAPDVAREISSELETMFSVLSDLGFAYKFQVRTQMDVVYFRHRDEYEKIAPKASGGFFVSETRDFERRHRAVLFGNFTTRAKRIIRHELTHFFVHAYYPQAPIWLHEGLAEFFETMEIDDETVLFGVPSRNHRFWTGPWSSEYWDGEYTLMIPMEEAPSVSSLRAMDVVKFSGGADLDQKTPEGKKALLQVHAHYAAAWSLVYVLFTDPNYRSLFKDYRLKLVAGETNEQAWRTTIGNVPEATLQKDYANTLQRLETLAFPVKYSPPPTPAPHVRALSDADVHVLWARLRDWETREGQAAAQHDIQEAGAHQPRHPELAALTAYWEDRRGNRSSAEKVLRAALAERPNDARLLNALGWVELNAIDQKEKTPSELAGVASKLAPMAKTAAELDLLAWNSFLHNDLDAALAYEDRAIEADPSCYQCLYATSIMLNENGRVGEALQTATLALHLLPDGVRPPKLINRIRSYRRHVQDADGAPLNSSPPKP